MRTIVVAVDFSESSAQAVRVAAALASRCGAALRLVHAETIEAPPYFTDRQIEALEAQRRQTRDQAARYLAAFARRHTDVRFEAVISTYPPVDAILNESADADLIVVGTHGRRGAARWWLGSVAERVLRETTRPLLIVRANGVSPGALLDRVDVRSFESRGESALAWVRALSSGNGHVVDRRGDATEPPGVTPETTMVALAVPEPRTPRWLARFAEPWLRASQVPIAFIPDVEM